MPHPAWKHYCTEHGSIVMAGSATCSSCGALGQYDGWHFGRIEAMGAYQRRTGFKPIGEHRFLADMILAPLLRPCELCGARGLIGVGENEWQRCPQCHGAMFVRNVLDPVFEAAQRRILRVYPGAAVP